MWAVKDGNILHAVDMTIQNEKADPKNPAAKSFQKATAKGPGWIDITEKDKDKKGKQGIEDPALLKEYILNIYKTMMLRGIRGTYVYVCDEALRGYLGEFVDKNIR